MRLGSDGLGARCAGSGASLAGVLARTVVLGRQTSGGASGVADVRPVAALPGSVHPVTHLARPASSAAARLHAHAQPDRIAVGPREQQPRQQHVLVHHGAPRRPRPAQRSQPPVRIRRALQHRAEPDIRAVARCSLTGCSTGYPVEMTKRGPHSFAVFAIARPGLQGVS